MRRSYREFFYQRGLWKTATAPGDLTELDVWLNKEFDQVHGIANYPEFTTWAWKRLYKIFDVNIHVHYKDAILEKFNDHVEAGASKKDANRYALEELLEAVPPVNFFPERENLHVTLGQILSWVLTAKPKYDIMTWEEAKRQAAAYHAYLDKKNKGVSQIQLESTQVVVNYVLAHPKVPDSDLKIEIIAVPKGMKEEAISDMEERCRQEGSQGDHCLYTNYWKTIKSGRAIALSFRAPNREFIATARIDLDDLVELKGYNNQPPDEDYKLPLLKWIVDLKSKGIINSISGVDDVGNLMSYEVAEKALEEGDQDLIRAALVSGHIGDWQIDNIYNSIKGKTDPATILMLKAIAGSRQTNVSLLEDMISVPEYYVLEDLMSAVANGHEVNYRIMEKLMEHPNPNVRYAMISGRNGTRVADQVTEDDLRAMGKNHGTQFNGRFLSFALANAKTPSDVVDSILKNENVPNSVTASIFFNERASTKTQAKVYESMHPQERKEILESRARKDFIYYIDPTLAPAPYFAGLLRDRHFFDGPWLKRVLEAHPNDEYDLLSATLTSNIYTYNKDDIWKFFDTLSPGQRLNMIRADMQQRFTADGVHKFSSHEFRLAFEKMSKTGLSYPFLKRMLKEDPKQITAEKVVQLKSTTMAELIPDTDFDEDMLKLLLGRKHLEAEPVQALLDRGGLKLLGKILNAHASITPRASKAIIGSLPKDDIGTKAIVAITGQHRDSERAQVFKDASPEDQYSLAIDYYGFMGSWIFSIPPDTIPSKVVSAIADLIRLRLLHGSSGATDLEKFKWLTEAEKVTGEDYSAAAVMSLDLPEEFRFERYQRLTDRQKKVYFSWRLFPLDDLFTKIDLGKESDDVIDTIFATLEKNPGQVIQESYEHLAKFFPDRVSEIDLDKSSLPDEMKNKYRKARYALKLRRPVTVNFLAV